MNFLDKVYFNNIFERFIPKFEYMLINSKSYSQEDLIKNQNALSLILIVDKIKRAEQISDLKNIPQTYFDVLEATTPEHLKKLICNVVATFLMKLDIPEDDLYYILNKIEEGRVSEMFALIDGYSVKETRRLAREEGVTEGITIGEAKGRSEGETAKAFSIAKNMIRRNRPIEEIIEDTGLTRKEVEGLRDSDL